MNNKWMEEKCAEELEKIIDDLGMVRIDYKDLKEEHHIAFYAKDLTFTELKVLLYLNWYGDFKGYCWPSTQNIADFVGIRRDHTSETIKKLEHKNIILVKTLKRMNNIENNLYILLKNRWTTPNQNIVKYKRINTKQQGFSSSLKATQKSGRLDELEATQKSGRLEATQKSGRLDELEATQKSGRLDELEATQNQASQILVSSLPKQADQASQKTKQEPIDINLKREPIEDVVFEKTNNQEDQMTKHSAKQILKKYLFYMDQFKDINHPINKQNALQEISDNLDIWSDNYKHIKFFPRVWKTLAAMDKKLSIAPATFRKHHGFEKLKQNLYIYQEEELIERQRKMAVDVPLLLEYSKENDLGFTEVVAINPNYLEFYKNGRDVCDNEQERKDLINVLWRIFSKELEVVDSKPKSNPEIDISPETIIRKYVTDADRAIYHPEFDKMFEAL